MVAEGGMEAWPQWSEDMGQAVAHCQRRMGKSARLRIAIDVVQGAALVRSLVIVSRNSVLEDKTVEAD